VYGCRKKRLNTGTFFFTTTIKGKEVQRGNHRLLIDPFVSGNPLSTVKADAIETDYILVSHGHGDHLGDTLEIAKRTGATVISNYEIQTWLVNQGIEKAHPQHIGGGFDYPWGRVKLTIAHHGSALPDGSYGGNPSGFLLYIDGNKIYHACDTGLFYDMNDALRAVKLIEPKQVVPIHYDTFDIIKQDPHAWAERVQKETSAKVTVMNPGESIDF
jgi:L-ascorbate metabolism protein UlaG (beta-lactamase superfamily)